VYYSAGNHDTCGIIICRGILNMPFGDKGDLKALILDSPTNYLMFILLGERNENRVFHIFLQTTIR
jgi:hypothetical protein